MGEPPGVLMFLMRFIAHNMVFLREVIDLQPRYWKLIGESLDKGAETDIVLLDFPKAFDSVCHARRLSFGFAQLPHWASVGSGAPQGSILTSFISNYINDMPDVVSSSMIVMFANDSKRFKLIDCMVDRCYCKLQNDLNSLNEWSIRNEILFQSPKMPA